MVDLPGVVVQYDQELVGVTNVNDALSPTVVQLVHKQKVAEASVLGCEQEQITELSHEDSQLQKLEAGAVTSNRGIHIWE